MAIKKATKRKTTAKRTVKKSAPKYQGNAYFWGGIAIALCATGAFIVLALGVGAMMQH